MTLNTQFSIPTDKNEFVAGSLFVSEGKAYLHTYFGDALLIRDTDILYPWFQMVNGDLKQSVSSYALEDLLKLSFSKQMKIKHCQLIPTDGRKIVKVKYDLPKVFDCKKGDPITVTTEYHEEDSKDTILQGTLLSISDDYLSFEFQEEGKDKKKYKFIDVYSVIKRS